ncbi:MAG: C39 family peptidase [Chloroflexia bacterium]|nr:C39 family peptidase [Chloroflexia bacterium]
MAIGRGTMVHRLATRRRGPIRALLGAIAEASPRGPRGPRGRSGRMATRHLVPAVLAMVVFLAGVSQAFAQPRTGLATVNATGASAARGGLRPTAVLRGSVDPLSARAAGGRLLLPAGALTYDVVPGDTLAGIASAHEVGLDALAVANGIADIDRINAGQRLVIPTGDGGGGGTAPALPAASPPATSVPAAPANEAWVSTVGTYVQQRNLSCEYAAAFIATSAFGAGVAEWVFWDQVPAATNPHYGYRGNIDGWWGNTDDYGVYPEALEPVLRANGFATETFYGLGQAAPLRERLDRGQPVLVWLGLWGDTAQTLWDDGRYTVAAGAHVVTVYGYDAWGVYASDPATGTYRAWAWADFLWMWHVLDGMALAISPA